MTPLFKPRLPVVDGTVWTFVGVVTNVVDGDTTDVELYVDTGHDEAVVRRRRIRVLHCNAPDNENPEGKRNATDYARARWLGKPVLVDVVKPDKYGGRDDGNVRTLDGAVDWARDLIAAGLAVPYEGGPR